MQIILLCGGSGTRLWPLSNQTRSKQFLKLFKAPNGSPESMFQRVLRQIRESKLNATINIATSQSQVDSVIAQGGDGISIITEPSRRDTFPAIALATSYLAKEKDVDKDETVIVMPCDPYTELGYFDVISKMADAVRSNFADLVLMGIKPNEPSSKFGYIMPLINQPGIADFFVEKPDMKKAATLMADGALWNGGVFAFKLGYLLNIVSKYSEFENFNDIKIHYDIFPKISFDYEVVEKAKSIGVVEYNGKWKDLGTWASLCKELPGATLGNVHSEDNTGTTILNELSLPIISRGCDNLIIAASPDGILVANKESAEAIKESVKEVGLRPMYEERRWGTYKVIGHQKYKNGLCQLTKQIILIPGKAISYQVHQHRDEIWTIVDGKGRFVLDGVVQGVNPGDVLIIKAGQKHAIKANSQLTLIEVQLGTELVESDIERYEYNWL